MQSLKYYFRSRLLHFLQHDVDLFKISSVVKDTLAMQHLAPLAGAYLPWSLISIKPTDLVRIINEIVVNGRRCVVECGAGVSTFYIAKILQQRGGHLFTVEHDERWAAIVKESLEQAGLSQTVSMILAPLAPTNLALQDCLWYDEAAIGNRIIDQKIDLLLVDGPPAFTAQQAYSRYSAVPYFKEFMAEDYAIVLDDINRPSEREILSKWEQLLGIRFKKYTADGRIAIGRSHPGFEV